MEKGDRVSVIDDLITGTVISVKPPLVIIETVDGFEMSFNVSELVVEGTAIDSASATARITEAISEKQYRKKQKSKRVKPKDRNAPPMEVDLHIHQLTSAKHMSNYDMLTLQLDTAKRQLEFAIRKRIQKVVFIHGVGEGVLKTELEYLFRKYDKVKYYEADYKKYGMGATEVYIYQNVSP